jgi:hypothetical protein
VFRGSALREDFQAFLANPSRRLASAETARRYGSEWLAAYSGNDRDLQGLHFDARARRVSFPDTMSPAQRAELSAAVSRAPMPQTGRYREYRLRWFRATLETLRSRGARAVFVRIPGSPVPIPRLHPAPDTALAAIARERLATVAPERQFSHFERPEYFFDALHLNRAGRERFTAELVRYLVAEHILRAGSV